MERHTRITGGLLIAALLVLGPVAGPARADGERRVRVELDGVSGALRDNVISLLSIAAAAREALPESEIERLHGRAPDEIATALQAFGYYRPGVTSSLDRNGSVWVARYQVDPGAPLRLSAVNVQVTGTGANDPGFRKCVADFPLKPGDVLDHTAYQRGKDAFPDLALRTGYLEGRFTAHEIRVDLDAYRAQIALTFDTGPRYRFGPVVFDQDFLDPRLLAGFVTIRQGQPFNTDEMIAMQARLGESPYFKRVEVEPRLDLAQGDEVPVHVQLTPNRRRKYGAGVGVATDGGIIVRVSAELRRINRKGHRAEVEAGYSEIERNVSGQYLIPWVHGRSDLLTLSGGYDDLRPETSRSRTERVGAGLVRSSGHLRSTYSLNFKRERFDVATDRGVTVFVTAEADWDYVRADNRLDTRRGYEARLDVQGADAHIFSDATFARGETMLKVIHPAGSSRRTIARLHAGVLQTADFRELPASLRFFAGGSQSVRGYAYQSLGPRDATGAVIGGEALLTASVELEQRFLERWGIAAFYDIGNAMRRLTDPLEAGVGLGLRWISPVGPVRVDAALPTHDLNGRVRFSLAIGPDL